MHGAGIKPKSVSRDTCTTSVLQTPQTLVNIFSDSILQLGCSLFSEDITSQATLHLYFSCKIQPTLPQS